MPDEYGFDKWLLISFPNKNPRGRRLLGMAQQLSDVARLVPFSTSVILTVLALVFVHVAMCCKVAIAVGIQVHI